VVTGGSHPWLKILVGFGGLWIRERSPARLHCTAAPLASLLFIFFFIRSTSASQSQGFALVPFAAAITRHCSCAHFLPCLEREQESRTAYCCRCPGQPMISLLFVLVFLLVHACLPVVMLDVSLHSWRVYQDLWLLDFSMSMFAASLFLNS
jgi:hypothetical protein